MTRQITFLPAIVCLIAASQLMAQAGEPILLGQSLTADCSNNLYGFESLITGMQFFIADTLQPFDTNSNGSEVADSQLTNYIGGTLILTNGQTGIFDFTITNCPGFAQEAARLTAGTNELSYVWGFAYNTNQIVFPAGGTGGQTWTTWNLPSGQDFSGSTITLFRLIVAEANWGQTNGGDYQVNGTGYWQIYGYPPPISPVPKLQIYQTPIQAILISWPTQAVGFVLQCGADITLPMTNVQTEPVTIGTNSVVLLPMNQTNAFFRLIYAP
jgi:hypothetical protein